MAQRVAIKVAAVVLAVLAGSVPSRGAKSPEPPPAVAGLNFPGGDLAGMPVSATSAAACAAMCSARDNCQVYTFHDPMCSNHGETCGLPGGCCWLKAVEERQALSNCTSSGRVRERPPEPGPGPAPMPVPHAASAKNVLYILVDDLRPELPLYGRPGYAPNIQALADGGLTFDRAYCQIAVCSPSRMSFLSYVCNAAAHMFRVFGRRPGTTRDFNFINHIRQATCGTRGTDAPVAGVATQGQAIGTTTADVHMSGAGQCCTDCATHNAASRNGGPVCVAWVHNSSGPAGAECTLLSTVTGSVRVPDFAYGQGAVISGVAPAGVGDDADEARPAGMASMQWSTLPGTFKANGYATCGTGKIFHTEEGGTGPAPWIGEGMPPLQDPPSWTVNCSMQVPNDPAPMLNCKKGGPPYCTVDADLDGNIADPSKEGPLADKVIGDDALAKLRAVKANRDATGQPFFLAVGFRKPHLAFRFPAPYLEYLLPENETDVPLHPTLDPSVPPIAHHDPNQPQEDPYTAPTLDVQRAWRQHYRGAVAWADHQIGVVLSELEALGLDNDTMVILHSDHGWNLGEVGSWRKFTNFELGTRVPLVMRVPWLPQSHGKRTAALAELVDIMPTALDLAQVGNGANLTDKLDGISLRPVLEDPSASVKQHALSEFARCPAALHKPGGMNESTWWQDNACEFYDRAFLPFVGLSMRTTQWRYTEWRVWNATTQSPVWAAPGAEPGVASSQVNADGHWAPDASGTLPADGLVGRELYDHRGDTGQKDYDSWEVKNLAAAHPSVVSQLAQELMEAFDGSSA